MVDVTAEVKKLNEEDLKRIAKMHPTAININNIEENEDDDQIPSEEEIGDTADDIIAYLQ
jgi:hypothetical protein